MADDTEMAWLTYEEAATRLGVKPDSVRRRAAARKWPRRRGNDGLARVGIPLSIIPDAIHDVTPDDPDDVGKLREALATATATISGLEDRLKDTQAERDRLAGLLEKSLEARPAEIVGIFGRLFRR